jgi:hypothetical protein
LFFKHEVDLDLIRGLADVECQIEPAGSRRLFGVSCASAEILERACAQLRSADGVGVGFWWELAHSAPVSPGGDPSGSADLFSED